MDFAAGVYLSEGRNHVPLPPPPYTAYVYTLYLFTEERGENVGEWNQREDWRGNSSQSWVENTNMTDCLSIYKLWETPARKV